MKQMTGMLLQLMVLGALPAIIYFELLNRSVLMLPIAVVVGWTVFYVGHRMRESK
ncbi:MAG: hypothetical protein KDA85_11225 [Planctomycetaceae bacterium]|nr:hypothetical protein [Planctomycetaceae bacterium]